MPFLHHRKGAGIDVVSYSLFKQIRGLMRKGRIKEVMYLSMYLILKDGVGNGGYNILNYTVCVCLLDPATLLNPPNRVRFCFSPMRCAETVHILQTCPHL